MTVRERARVVVRGRRARLTVLPRLELLVTERTDCGLCAGGASIAVEGRRRRRSSSPVNLTFHPTIS